MRHKSQTCLIIILTLIMGMSGPAYAQLIHRDNRANPFTDMKRLSSARQISIDKLQPLSETVDIEFCLERYGTGYTVSPAPNGDSSEFVTDKGHKFHLYARTEQREGNIYSEHSEILAIFPNEPDNEVDITQFITGILNSEVYSGVFSDGDCAGTFSIVSVQ